MNKNNKGLFVAGAVVVVVLVIGVVAMAMSGKKDTESNSSMSAGDTSMKMEGDSSDTTNANSAAVATDKVTIADYKYGPANITVKVGTKVTWTNTDSVSHDVYPDNPSDDFKPGDLFGKGESYSYTFTKAGTYPYHCTPHPYMKGTVTVTE